MNAPVRSVVIVGGGTAGWLTASVIAARYQAAGKAALKVTLVESPNISTVGVGEGTWPTMRETLRSIGVDETEFMRHCDAAFKQGSKFIGWRNGADVYHHPFSLPRGYEAHNSALLWLTEGGQVPFGEAVSFQPAIADRHLAPKLITTPAYAGLAHYAYHLNSGKFAAFLTRHATEKLGVEHILADVIAVRQDEEGFITALDIGDDRSVAGDLFVDCTGFAARLIQAHYGVPSRSCQDKLPIDTALATQVPYPAENAPVASVTLSTAQSAGWIWDIGLPTRRGVGYVFSSAFTSQDQAVADLARYTGLQKPEAQDLRLIPIRAGYRERAFVGNCVAIGLSSGFVEPLEASSIVMVELSARMLAELMPADRAAMAPIARRFNDTVRYRWERIVDFLKLHYVLSQRDEPFWRANRDEATIPDSLKELLLLYRHHAPWRHDFTAQEEVFSAASYQYVLYGMGFATELPAWQTASTPRDVAQRYRQEVAQAQETAMRVLPTHRDLLDRLQKFSFQAV